MMQSADSPVPKVRETALSVVARWAELAVLILLFVGSYGHIKTLDMSGENPLYVDAVGYGNFAQMILDGTAFDSDAARNSMDRVRRPIGFPLVIFASSAMLSIPPAEARAVVHYGAGLLVLLVLWCTFRTKIAPGAVVVSLWLSGFFDWQDPFRGGITEWLTLLGLILGGCLLFRFLAVRSLCRAFQLVFLLTCLCLVKAVFLPLLILGALALASLAQGGLLGRVIAVVSGMVPLLVWSAVNIKVLGTPSPAVDLGYNLFGIVGLLPWEDGSRTETDPSRFKDSLNEKRASAQGDLYEFLNSRAVEVSVQDYNLWVVAKPQCEEFKLDYLECEETLRAIAFEVIGHHPRAYFEYVRSQLLLDKNREPLVVAGLFLLLACMTRLRLFFREPHLSEVVIVLSVVGVLNAVLHASLAQLYRRYTFPSLNALLIFGTLMLLCQLVLYARSLPEPTSKS